MTEETDKFYLMFSIPPLMEAKYPYDDIDTIANYVQSTLHRRSIANWTSKETHLLDDDVCKNLKKHCLDSVHKYTRNILNSDHEILMTQSWSSITKPGQHHPKHYHANSFLSGVFYLQSDEEVSPITFDGPLQNFSVRPEFNTTNEFMNDSYTTKAKQGYLYLFPSTLPHFVSTNTSSEDRISISFNTFPKPPFGSEENFSQLDL